jgi:methionine-rich copper-binding protein CopC
VSAHAFRRLALVPLLAVLALISVVLAPPAHAHDVLISSEPADGAQLGSAPSEIVLTFNNELLDSAQAVIVTDGSGATVAEGAPTVQGKDATFPLPALGAGEYTAEWSVVSSDGHRIDGRLGFAVAGGAAEPTTEAGAAPSAPAPTSSPDELTTPDATATAPAEEEGTAAGGLPAWLVVLLAVGALGAVVAVAVRRWRDQG